MSVYFNRRQRLLKTIGKNGIALIASAPEVPFGPDMDYPFRQNPNLYYLTGFSEPESILMLVPGRAEGESILFNRPRDPAQEVWMGPRAGQEGAVRDYGLDQAFPIHEFTHFLSNAMKGRERVYLLLTSNSLLLNEVLVCLDELQQQSRAGVIVPKALENVDYMIRRMRLIKDDDEINTMRTAAKISADIHCEAMRRCKPGMNENDFDALFTGEFKRRGCNGSAYSNIIAAGNNATILHYHRNKSELNDGDLLLIDAGGDYQGYAADITRTYPINGRFTKDQRDLYEAVLRVQKEAITLIKPGFDYHEYQVFARKRITEECVGLGLLKGDPEKLYEEGAYKKFYMHNLGHWIGMDVHDHVGGMYRDLELGKWIPFEPGMTITCEPGLYIPHGTEGVDKKWWGMGIRIEDDILVTKEGSEIMSAGVPKEVDEIEALMASA